MKRKFLLTFFVLLAIVFTFASCDLIKGSEESKCTHTTVDENRIEPTCIKDGSYDSVIYCTVCEEEFLRENIIIPATGHNYVNGTCSVCGEAEFVSAGNEYVRCDKDGTPNANGDYILFGEYPQTIKSNEVTVTSTVDARGYYLGSDGEYYAKVTATPYKSGYTFSTGANVISGEVYYFKVESIRWRILEEKNGEMFIFCDSVISNRRFDDSSCNYANSEVREWLNGEFYNTTFNEMQKLLILTTMVDNSAASTGTSNNRFACENTEDKIFLLSYAEATNSAYGFVVPSDIYDSARDTTKRIKTSDYSRACGVYHHCSSLGYGDWWLRSPHYGYVVSTANESAWVIHCEGGLGWNRGVSESDKGIVPAMWINVGNTHSHTLGDTVVENNVTPTCTTGGSYDNVVYCTECEVEISRKTVTVDATGHNYENGTCSICGEAEYVSTGNEYVRCDKDGTPNANGDYILFGEYPQTLKADNVSITTNTDSRGYYLGSDGCYYAKVGSNFYKVEPLCWRILSENDEDILLLCENIIANMAYSTNNSNNYKNSNVRAWLNGSFYENAFSQSHQQIIRTTKVDNSALSTGYASNPNSYEDTEDKIFLLSYADVINTNYGFSDSEYDDARKKIATEYARATGSCNSWRLRSHGTGSTNVRQVNSSGSASSGDYLSNVRDTVYGIVPAMWINVGNMHTHSFVDGYCSCGESDPDFEENLNASEGLSYSYSNGGYKVTGIGTCKDSNVVIPATYNGYPVVAIADNAFRGCESITTLKFAKDSSVTDIGFCAFYECDNLVTVQLPVSLKSFSTCVFYGCQKLTDIYISSDNNYFSTIDGDLYDKNQTKFLQYALAKQNESFIVQEGITTIDRTAFAGAVYLEKLSLPKSVNVLGFEALVGCKRLKEIIVDESNATYKTINGDLYNKNGSTLIQYALGKENVDFVVPIGVITINRAAFEDCEKLTSVHISKTVKVISSLAFRNCSKLEIVTFDKDSQLNTIEYTAFYDCINLESIQIPDGVTALQKYAFYNCKNLVSVVIPDGFTEIGYQAFTGCSNLVIYYKGTSTSWSNITIDSAGASYVKNAVKYFYTPTAPTQSGNYWYYDENDNITIW